MRYTEYLTCIRYHVKHIRRMETNAFLSGPSKQTHETASETFNIDQENDTSWEDTETNLKKNQRHFL